MQSHPRCCERRAANTFVMFYEPIVFCLFFFFVFFSHFPLMFRFFPFLLNFVSFLFFSRELNFLIKVKKDIVIYTYNQVIEL